MSAASIPLGDAGPLWPARNRTRVLRVALALVLAGTGAAAFLTSRTTAGAAAPYLGTASRGIVVLDLSASVENLTLDRMYETLASLSRSGGRYGLVVFSDQAYEALPPGTPASELADYAAFFRKETKHGGGDLGPSRVPVVVYPTNPWQNGFSFGTTISAGLDLARSIIQSDHVTSRNVLLVSDLDDNASDLPLVTQSAKALVHGRIALQVLPLNPEKRFLGFFRSLPVVAGGGVVAAPPRRHRGGGGRAFPVDLGVAALLLALLLAANELWSTPLEWRATPA